MTENKLNEAARNVMESKLAGNRENAGADGAGRLLEVKNLRTTFRTLSGEVQAVRGTSFYVNEGESIGIVGESGCGKSVSMLSVLHLLDDNAKMDVDEIIFNGKDISRISTREMRKLNGHEIGMIFQDPMTSLNPVFTIEQQIRDPLMRHLGYTKAQAKERALETLAGSEKKG